MGEIPIGIFILIVNYDSILIKLVNWNSLSFLQELRVFSDRISMVYQFLKQMQMN